MLGQQIRTTVNRTDFAMFTRAGNKAVAAAVREVVNNKALKTRKARVNAIAPMLIVIGRKFGEVYDTMVRESVLDALPVRRRA